MANIIGFFLVIAAFVLFPYRKIYHGLNRILDTRMLLGGIAFIAFRFIWHALVPEAVEASSQTPVGDLDFQGRFDVQLASFAEVLGWLFVVVGVVMVCFAIWTARDHQRNVPKKSA